MTQQDLVKRQITRDLPVKLTEAELAAIAKEIGRQNNERGTMEAQAKMSSDQWKDRIRGVDASIADLAAKAHTGVENRPTVCEEEFDYRLGEVRIVRVDTREKLEVRPMTPEERQPNLPAVVVEAAPADGKKKRGKKDKADKAEPADDGVVEDDYHPDDTLPPE